MPPISFELVSTCPRTGARLYEAKLGRFLTRDPIGHEGGLNLYAYCNNNPVNCVDPDGRDGLRIGDMEFNLSSWSMGLSTGLSALGEAFSFGHYKNDYYAGRAGYDVSYGCAVVGREALIGAGTAGAGNYVSGLRAARGTVSVTSWRAAEVAAASKIGGVSQRVFQTPLGRRIVDQFAKGIAHEVKYGYQSLSQATMRQIQKDVALRNGGQIRGVMWHFYKSATSGAGPSKPLLEALRANGIRVKIH